MSQPSAALPGEPTVALPVAPEQPSQLQPQSQPQPNPEPLPDCPPELLALQSLHAAEGLRRIGGRVAAYTRQLQRFRQHYASAGAELQALVAQKDWQHAEEYCHSLKGVTGNIGAVPLYECLVQIDNQLKQAHAPQAAQLQDMDQLLRAVLADIGTLKPAETTAAPPEHLSRAQLLALTDELASALESDLGRAEVLLVQLRDAVAGSRWQALVDELAQKVDNFDIDPALALVAQLRSQLAAAPTNPPLEPEP